MTDNFWDKRNTNWFKQNPQNANRKWQPKKWIALVNAKLKADWYTPATKADIIETYTQMVNLNNDRLKELQIDESQPMLVRILAENILSKKWFDIVEKMLDRWIWKATENKKIETNVTIISEDDLED